VVQLKKHRSESVPCVSETHVGGVGVPTLIGEQVGARACTEHKGKQQTHTRNGWTPTLRVSSAAQG
jgi:hypothetical protein